MTLAPKPVNDSAVHYSPHRAFPNDLNPKGTVFGGLVMSTLDRICSVVAERHSGRVCVTAAVDSMQFKEPARGGDILVYMASVNRTWRTSMEIGAKVIAENYRTGERRHIVSAYFTFVALDENDQPIAVPPVMPETPLEKRRFEEADQRRQHRKVAAEQQKLRRQQNGGNLPT